ncbi:3-oxoacid CoA-transferase subunit B [Thermodesulfobacteriota bacterium]
MVDKEKLPREVIAMRAAKEFQDGMVVNLGVGIPTLAGDFIPEEKEIIFHTENGCLGFGPIAAPEDADLDLVNAGTQAITVRPGMSFFDHADSFGMIRCGRVDICVLGGLQVSEKGDLANWITPGRAIGNIGGGMDLAFCAKTLIIAMEHTTKKGEPKIVKECSMPLTAPHCVDLIITDVGVIDVTEEGLVLKEVAPGWTAEEVQELTEPKLIIDPNLQDVQLF